VSGLRLEVRPFRLRLAVPLSTAHGILHARDGVLVRAAEGALEGVGEASPLAGFGTEDAARALAVLEQASARLAGALLPSSAAELDSLLDESLPAGVPAARAALECALLDLRARRESRPLRDLLAAERASIDGARSGPALEQLPLSALLPDSDPAAAAARAVREGFATVKLKVAARPLASDLERARAVRAAAGAEVAVRLDANGGWPAEDAAAALAALAEVRPELCEQPVAPGGAAAWTALSRLCPLAADESCADLAEVEELLRARVLRAVVLKLPVLGGLLPALRLARTAAMHGAAPLVTCALDGTVGRAAAAHLAAALRVELAAGLATARLLAEDLCADPFAPVRGCIHLGTAPGLGVAL
jgi:o-succinylbenzoate synthase